MVTFSRVELRCSPPCGGAAPPALLSRAPRQCPHISPQQWHQYVLGKRGGGLVLSPSRRRQHSGARKAATSTGWAVPQPPPAPSLGEEQGEVRSRILIPAHSSHTLLPLARQAPWTCGEGCTQSHQPLFVQRFDLNQLVQSPDLSLSRAWLQLPLSPGARDRS